MTIQARPQPAHTRSDQFPCRHCGATLTKFSRQITVRQDQCENFGDPPNRQARTTTLEALVVCSWPCLVGYIADHHSP